MVDFHDCDGAEGGRMRHSACGGNNGNQRVFGNILFCHGS